MYRIQYFIFIIFRKIIMMLPEKSRFKFADAVGVICYYLIKKRRWIALANIKIAFPEKTYEERKKIAINSFKTMFKAFISTLWFQEYLDNQVIVEDFNRLKKAKEKDVGVAVGVMHMGNMEASLKIAKIYRVITVAKAQRNPYIDRFITEGRNKSNIILLKKSKKTSRELIKYIKNKDVIGLFTDHRDKGTTVKFFGIETVAPTGIINLALRYDMPLLLVYNILHRDNSCTTYITKEIELIKTDSFKQDVKVNTQIMMDMIENIIRNYPEQWLWFHDRWKIYKTLKKSDIKN